MLNNHYYIGLDACFCPIPFTAYLTLYMSYKAFLFDLNGTMIDDMNYHADAWFDLLNNDLKQKLSRGEVEEQMYGKNSEVLTRIFGKRKFNPMRMEELSH